MDNNDLKRAIRATTITMSAAEFSRSQELLLNASSLLEKANKEVREKQVLYAGACEENRELKKQIEDLKALVVAMEQYIIDSLETFEAMFESDEGSFTYDRMAQYVLVAGFMRAWKGRPCIVARVEERMKQLPWED